MIHANIVFKIDNQKHLKKLRGRQQNVSGQLSGFWPLRFYPLPPPVIPHHTKTQKFVDLSIQKKTGSKLS